MKRLIKNFHLRLKAKTSLKDRDRSTIYCLALLFEYFGSGRIYGSDLLARLMYSNVLNNPGYVRWSLMIVDFFVSGMALIKSPFYAEAQTLAILFEALWVQFLLFRNPINFPFTTFFHFCYSASFCCDWNCPL